MTLVRHVAAEFRRARPNYFDDRLAYETHGAPKLDEAATAARYELHSILRIMRALGPTYFILDEIREGEAPTRTSTLRRHRGNSSIRPK